MSDIGKSFDFSALVPGFDFLKNLTAGSARGAGSAVPGLPGMTNWVAPTLSVEEVEKRIQELKTVQFWLDQNMTALKATIQALEVQKMTLSTLKGMNLHMEDFASAFTGGVAAASAGLTNAAKVNPFAGFSSAANPSSDAPVAATDAVPSPETRAAAPGKPAAVTSQGDASGKAAATGTALVDPLQWWGALTQQFEQIASSALNDAAGLKMPAGLQAMVDQTKDVFSGKTPSGSGVAAKKSARPVTAKAKANPDNAGAGRTAAQRAPASASRAGTKKR